MTKPETLMELVERLDTFGPEIERVIEEEWPRISGALKELVVFIRDGLYSDDILVEMGRQLLARLDQEKP